MLKADASGLPIDATNTDAEAASAVSLKHTQGTDQGLDTGGANAVTAAQAKAGYTHSGVAHAPSDAVALATVKADADIASAISLKHTQGTDTALGAVGTKNPPIDADLALYRDSAAANVLVTSTWTQVKAFLKTYFDTLYNLYVHPNHSGDVTSVADGATTIGAGKVTLAMMANMATASLLGRNTAGAGVPEVITDIPTAVTIGTKYIYRADGTDVPIADGGTGQSTAQTAINALTAVSGATNEHVLTKDTATGNAIFKVSGSISLSEVLTWSTL
jgi:hypothetical protein